jgi:hypothetical protein
MKSSNSLGLPLKVDGCEIFGVGLLSPIGIACGFGVGGGDGDEGGDGGGEGLFIGFLGK